MVSGLAQQCDHNVVSQFTLHAILKGNKTDFHIAMSGDEAKKFYDTFLDQLRHVHGTPEAVKGCCVFFYSNNCIENRWCFWRLYGSGIC